MNDNLHGRVGPGFTFLCSLIAIFRWHQCSTLGIMGEFTCAGSFPRTRQAELSIDSSN